MRILLKSRDEKEKLTIDTKHKEYDFDLMVEDITLTISKKQINEVLKELQRLGFEEGGRIPLF